MSAGVLRIDRVGKSYGDGARRVVALDECSLEVAPGELRVLVGPSGCGKTTLLHAVAGFHPISTGEIRLDGRLLCGPGQLQAEPGPDRVVVFQSSALFPWRTVLANVTYGLEVQRRLPRSAARELGRRRLAEAGLDGLEERYPASSRAGCSGASSSCGHWPPSRACCCSTSRSGAWTRSPDRSCRRRCSSSTTGPA